MIAQWSDGMMGHEWTCCAIGFALLLVLIVLVALTAKGVYDLSRIARADGSETSEGTEKAKGGRKEQERFD